MKRLLLLAIFCVCSVVGDSTNSLQYFWITDLSTLVRPPGTPVPEGLMVFVRDTSVETTHYYVTVEYLSRNNSRVRVERLNEKTNPKGLTPVYLEAHDVTMVINITVIALKQTGHRSGIVGFGQAS